MTCPATAPSDVVPSEATGPSGSGRRPSITLSRFMMTRDAMTVGLSPKNGWVSHIEGHDVARFSTATRHFVALCHPEYIDDVLHAGRLNYYKSYEYELLRAILGVSLFTDEEDSWQRYRTMLSPMFAKRHLNGLVELMIEPIDALLTEYGKRGAPFELDVVGNSLFSQGFGPIAAQMSSKVTGGLRFGERMLRLFLVTAPPKKVWRGLPADRQTHRRRGVAAHQRAPRPSRRHARPTQPLAQRLRRTGRDADETHSRRGDHADARRPRDHGERTVMYVVPVGPQPRCAHAVARRGRHGTGRRHPEHRRPVQPAVDHGGVSRDDAVLPTGLGNPAGRHS